jgi:hypothetical protein
MSISDGLVVVTMSPSQSWRLGFGQIRITTTAKKNILVFWKIWGFSAQSSLKGFTQCSASGTLPSYACSRNAPRRSRVAVCNRCTKHVPWSPSDGQQLISNCLETTFASCAYMICIPEGRIQDCWCCLWGSQSVKFGGEIGGELGGVPRWLVRLVNSIVSLVKYT